ncbi:MAG: hypothetical protein PW734_03985 [Verrucomicrobium sp.]|nr:hypothetical protein [Verrucomicrobium sp.]
MTLTEAAHGVRDYAREIVQLSRAHPKEAALAFLNLVPFVGTAAKGAAILLHQGQAHRLEKAGQAEEAALLRARIKEEKLQVQALGSMNLLSGIVAAATRPHQQPSDLVVAGVISTAIGVPMAALDFLAIEENGRRAREVGATPSSAGRSQSR